MTTSFSLDEIAKWDRSQVVPELQRGLVWKPAQIELLWDSILRGFPIGSFITSENTEKFLLDGQQRYNAIWLGYNSNIENPQSVVWLDVRPPKDKATTRKYWIRVTTLSHPWGYKQNDECTILELNERRDAMTSFGFKESDFYKNEVSLLNTWPWEATKPIPLFCFLKADANDECGFTKDVIRLYNESRFRGCDKSISEKDKVCIKELYNVFCRVKKYQIHRNIVPSDTYKEETENVDEDKSTSIEILFNRLNTLGTRITSEELMYSAIKAYWPEIQKENDYLASKRMSAPQLSIMTFRLVLMLQTDKDKLQAAPSIRKIRVLSNEPLFKKLVLDIYQNNLEKMLCKVDKWMGVSENSTPPILRTSIVRNSPEVFLLLLWLAYQSDIGNLTENQIKSLAFAIHWYSRNQAKVSEVVFRYIKNKGKTIESIRQAIALCVSDNSMMRVFKPDQIRELIDLKCFPEWSPTKHVPMWDDFYYRTSHKNNRQAREILLYAERNYMKNHFAHYDPARKDIWEGYNRPWDYDHIIPQDWINSRHRSKYQALQFKEFCQKWLNNIGNIAAISYVANRSKGAQSEYNEYVNNARDLHFNKDVQNIDYNVTGDEAAARLFATLTLDRFCSIYKDAYDNLLEPLFATVTLPVDLARRKEKLERIKANTDCDIFYWNGEEYRPIESDEDWCMEHLCVGKVSYDGKCLVAYECGVQRFSILSAQGKDVDMNLKNQIKANPDFCSENAWEWGYGSPYYCYINNGVEFDDDNISYIMELLKKYNTIMGNKE